MDDREMEAIIPILPGYVVDKDHMMTSVQLSFDNLAKDMGLKATQAELYEVRRNQQLPDSSETASVDIYVYRAHAE